jgi:hypothetical protein
MKPLTIIFSLLLLTGCFREDEKLVPTVMDIVEIPYSMYDYQIWYNLQNKSVVSYNLFSEWDLGFESSGTDHRIILNTSRFMHAGNTESTDFKGITTNICDTMLFDDSTGDLSKTAIGKWADFTNPVSPVFFKNVYIIDLGSDNSGISYGQKKVIFEHFANNIYSLRYSNLDGSDEHIYQITADNSRSFTLFSFRNGGSVMPVQPINSDWDLCFTQYSTILFDDNNVATPYLVRGVYLNPSGTSAVSDTINSYSSITATDISNYRLSNSQDAIGYLWKDYKNDSYKINPRIFYIIKDKNGAFYKLKFTGFYSKSGARGYPSFQVSNLSGSQIP